jgi:hypothetical protein
MKTDETSPPLGGGAEYIKAALATRRRKGHLAPIARDCNTGVSVLESWIDGFTTLKPDLLRELARHLLGAEYDEHTDLLRSARRTETLPLAAGYQTAPAPSSYPPPWRPSEGPIAHAHRPVKPEPAAGRRTTAITRPGWAAD